MEQANEEANEKESTAMADKSTREWCLRNISPAKFKLIRWCKHCNNRRMSRQELCYSCYNIKSIRYLYVDRFARTGSATIDSYKITKRALPEPTRALPGTLEKIAVLEDRATRGVHLWHPDDATWKDVLSSEEMGVR
jgi:hypothetical protein